MSASANLGTVRWICVVLAAWCVPSLMARHAVADFIPPDCGTSAVYILLRLVGHPKELNEVYAALPPRGGSGYSMLELQQAARICGVELRGGYVTGRDLPLTRPAIAHLEGYRGQGGHFVVLVPVGDTGKMVQVIEPPFYPKVLDYSDLMRGEDRLRVLIPVEFWESWYFVFFVCCLCIIIIGFVLLGIICRKMGRSWFLGSGRRRPSPAGIAASSIGGI